MPSIGENICRRRVELGMTQEELAEKLGYKSKSSINKIELGVNDLPQRKIVLFAKALHTTPAALMGWDQDGAKEYKKSAALASVAKRLQSDPGFFDIVLRLQSDPDLCEFFSMLVDLPAEEYATYKQVLAAFRNKKLPNKE